METPVLAWIFLHYFWGSSPMCNCIYYVLASFTTRFVICDQSVMKISLTGANGHQIGRMQGIWRHFLILKNFLDYWQLRFNYCLKVLKRGEAKYCFCESFFIKKNHVMKFISKTWTKTGRIFCFKICCKSKIWLTFIAFKIRSIRE